MKLILNYCIGFIRKANMHVSNYFDCVKCGIIIE